MLQSGEYGFGPTSSTTIEAAPGALVRPADPGSFRAGVRWVRLDHLLIRVLTAQPHTIEWSPSATEESLGVSITVMGSGALDGTVDGADVHLGPGQAMVLDTGHPMICTVAVPVRVLTVTLDIDRVPLELRAALQPVRPLRRTPLLNSYIAFVSALMSRPLDEDGGPDDDAHLGRALADLHVGVLAEGHGATLPRPGSDGMRYRIMEYVDANLSDPGLAPGAIAAALGISLRYAHRVFDQDDVTLARFIRERRLGAIATALGDARTSVSIGELATRFGFGSRDRLTRSFRERYGLTPSAYRDAEAGRIS